MKCPRCHADYFSHVTSCSDCNIPLVDPQSISSGASNKEKRLSSETVVFNEGTRDHCKEIVHLLQSHGIACASVPMTLTAGDNAATLGAANQLKYLVLIEPADIERAQNAMKQLFADQVLKEGRGALVDSVVNVDAGEITCPACGETAALEKGECTTCGLFLGEAPDPTPMNG
jgi:hypothetical protein